MKEIFLKVKKLIDEENFAALNEIKYNKPESFNWVKEILKVSIYRKDQKRQLYYGQMVAIQKNTASGV